MIYQASFFQTFLVELLELLPLLALSIFALYQLKHGSFLRNRVIPGPAYYSRNSPEHKEFEKTLTYKLVRIWLKFSTVCIIVAFLFLTYLIAHNYLKGPVKLICKVQTKKIEGITGKRNEDYKYVVEPDKYPHCFFEVNKSTYELIKVGTCYEIQYYGTLSYHPPLKEIRQIKELNKCN